MSFDAIGLGLCAWDRVLLFERYPRADQKVEAISSIASGGGPVPTALAAFSRLGGKATFIGVVGDDFEGQWVRADLSRFSVGTSRLVVRPGRKTPCAHIWVDRGTGKRTVALDRGDAEPLQSDELPQKLIRATPLLLMDGRNAETCLTAARLCSEGGGRVVLDAGSPRQHFRQLLAVTDHAVVSADFARGTFPGLSPIQAARSISELGPASVVVTCGKKGGYWRENDREGRYRSFDVEAVDTTGAGDVFHGAYLFGLKAGYDLSQRCEFASASAALACRGLGGRSSLPSYQDVTALLGKGPREACGGLEPKTTNFDEIPKKS